MTQDRDLERLLDTWLSDGPTIVADRVIDDVAVRIVRQPQRPAWRLRPWRFPTMSTQLRLAVLAGALLAAVLAGGVLFLGGGGSKPSVTAPTSTPATSASPEPSAITLQSVAGLPPGRYTTQLDAGRLTFTLPPGWSSSEVLPSMFALHLDSGPTNDTVRVFTDIRRSSKDAACTEAPQAGVGVTADLLAGDLAGDPNLTALGQSSIQLTPELGGQVLDIALAAGATKTCPFSKGQPTVPLIVDSIPGQGAFWGIGPNEKIRLVILDALNGHNLAVAMDSADGTSFDALTAATTPIIQSFAFEAAPGPRDLTEGTLTAGTYRLRPFDAAPTMEIRATAPAGWKGFPKWALIGPNGSESPGGIGIGFLMPAGLFKDPCHWDASGRGSWPQQGDVTVGPTVDDLVAALRSNGSYQAAAPIDSTVGGFPAKRVDLQLPGDVDFATACDKVAGNANGAFLPWGTAERDGSDLYAQGPSNRWHVYAVDVVGTRVVVVVDDYAATPAADQAAAQSILESLAIVP